MTTRVRAALVAAALLLQVGSARAQTLVANDDAYGVPYGTPLEIEAFGVLDNDTLDDEAAGEVGAVAELVVDVSHGTLAFASDGSFRYAPGASFAGSDAFTYRAVFGLVSSHATVTLSACNGGPEIFTCWKEGAFLAMAAEAGLPSFQEGFEDDAVWGGARYPTTVRRVSGRGFAWRANDFDPTHLEPPFPASPAPNHVTTGPGPARTGLWGIFDLEHGYAVGSIGQCDVEAPPEHCFYHDGVTVSREPGSGVLHGVGGHFRASNRADVAIVVDGDWQNPIAGGVIYSAPYQFFGVMDTGPLGFSEVQFREVDGRVSDAFLVFADDFTILAEPVATGAPVPVLGGPGLVSLGALLLASAAATLRTARGDRPRQG